MQKPSELSGMLFCNGSDCWWDCGHGLGKPLMGLQRRGRREGKESSVILEDRKFSVFSGTWEGLNEAQRNWKCWRPSACVGGAGKAVWGCVCARGTSRMNLSAGVYTVTTIPPPQKKSLNKVQQRHRQLLLLFHAFSAVRPHLGNSH